MIPVEILLQLEGPRVHRGLFVIKVTLTGRPDKALKRYAENAPGNTDTYPKLLSSGLSVQEFWT